MSTKKVAVITALLLLLVGVSSLSAQAFFPTRVKGTFEVKFLPPIGGVAVQVSIDDQVAGVLPLTVYVLPGPHKFTFFAGDENKTVTYPVKGDVSVPSIFSPKGYPLTVNTNVPGAALALDGKPFAGNSTTVGAGNHTLSVSAAGYQSVTIPFTQPASSNTLNVTLVGNSFPLTVNVNPVGASLAMDGNPFAGNSLNVAPGAHTLTVSAPGYQSVSVPFNQPSQANILNVTLVANTFPLTVNTNVPNASLAVDGNAFAGRSTSVAPGAHTLTVSAAGYQPLTVPFNQPSQANILNVTLIASTFPLTVNTNAPGASLAVDGAAFAGNTTSVSAGGHTLTVAAPGFQTLSIPFTQPSQANILNVTLMASTGTLLLNLDQLPKNAQAYKVFVDGAETRNGIPPLTAGPHNIRLTSGNQSLETTVNVVAGQTLTLTPSIHWDVR